jgi:drug/metabolite transporter (DMT)-like permease
MKTFALTAIALVAFAANSVLCRLALHDGAIDAASFTLIRVLSGAAMLLIVAAPARRRSTAEAGSWLSAFIMAVYAVPFAFAYTQLSAGTGALILFGCVQVTMVAAALGAGHQPRAGQWLGIVLALAGLVYLVLPGLAAPPLTAALLMAVAGVCWGLYSLRGRGAANPLAQTTDNFVRAVPFVGVASLLALPGMHVQTRGVILAAASGALTSGLGYVVWYAALRGLTATQAAVVQLAVPLLAAVAGIVLLSEVVSLRLVIAAALVLGGIGMTIGRGRP